MRLRPYVLTRRRKDPAGEPGAAIFIGLFLYIEVSGRLPKPKHLIGLLAVFIVVRGIGGVELSPQTFQFRPAQGFSLGEKGLVRGVLARMTSKDDGTANIVIIKRRPHHVCRAGRRGGSD